MKKHQLKIKPGTIVLSVGGSLVVPNGEIDVKFLRGLKKLIEAQVKKGWHFVIVVGGGGTARPPLSGRGFQEEGRLQDKRRAEPGVEPHETELLRMSS